MCCGSWKALKKHSRSRFKTKFISTYSFYLVVNVSWLQICPYALFAPEALYDIIPDNFVGYKAISVYQYKQTAWRK
jgi:hypothetical protein